jgi:hypothetical protein
VNANFKALANAIDIKSKLYIVTCSNQSICQCIDPCNDILMVFGGFTCNGPDGTTPVPGNSTPILVSGGCTTLSGLFNALAVSCLGLSDHADPVSIECMRP